MLGIENSKKFKNNYITVLIIQICYSTMNLQSTDWGNNK